jgi:hypothetical protein
MVSPELFQLPVDELTLPEMLDLGNRRTLRQRRHREVAPLLRARLPRRRPNVAGFDHFAGTPANLGFDPSGYYDWVKVVDGTFFVVLDTYATTDQVDEALVFLQSGARAWLCYVAFSAAHVALPHAPSRPLHRGPLDRRPAEPGPAPLLQRQRSRRSTREIGRLFSGLGPQLPHTNVIFAGDNGTTFEVVVPPFDPDHAKGHPLRGRAATCHMIVAGRPSRSRGAQCNAIGRADRRSHATVAELAGVSLEDVLPAGTLLDSVSMVPYLQDPAAKPRRETMFSEIFGPLGSAPYNHRGHDDAGPALQADPHVHPRDPGLPRGVLTTSRATPSSTRTCSRGGLSPGAARRLPPPRSRDARSHCARLSSLAPRAARTTSCSARAPNASGGRSASLSYNVASQIGVGAYGAVSSSTRRARPGTTWLTGGIASDHPTVFGFGDARGAKLGGDTRSLFGFGSQRACDQRRPGARARRQERHRPQRPLRHARRAHDAARAEPVREPGRGVETLWLRTGRRPGAAAARLRLSARH